ncbi:DNA-binding transcriptional regulator, LacI/PurR family [Raineyella antarctica]|uniref:DNA-binding transcriptional regulator, LacI/PurR family n=1 Tax=Raineyella antarctica TaxID=1577474 RepID=A0A1G6GHL9_9ACTN|nr:LacI family DNA-binding transcriptional regulator [Raineyella antarctica]SDB81389.1 DNA-binding transcriptional regulator, LacI/PurR family [Raineyella antarctica]
MIPDPVPPRGSVSMGDVAKLAGVSAQTVSRVARGEASVRPETAERVRRAMLQLSYVPNRAARALRYGAFRTIGVVGHRIARTGEAHIIEAIITALRAVDYEVMLIDTPTSSAEHLVEAFSKLGRSVDGMVVLRLETPVPAQVALPPGMPIVVGDFRFADSHTAVGTDQAGGTRQAVEHLLGLGHRTVHHVSGPTTSVQAAARERAWAACLARADRPVPEVLRGDWTPRSGYAAGQLLAADPDVTAVFCANDEMALGLLRAFHEAGRRVPDEVSVVGFDDIMAEWLWPPLTTIAQDFAAIGRELVSALMGQLAEPERASTERVLVSTRLVVRRSTGPAR